MATPEILHSLYGKRFGIGPNGELILNGSRVTGATGSSSPALWAGAPALGERDPSTFFLFFDDFVNQASATASSYHAYATIDDSGTGTNAFQDAAGGVYNVVTAAADNDYHAMTSVGENWLFAAGKELWFEARFKLAEATVLESTWWYGLMDITTTGGMQANALGPLASYDGALIWKTPETAMTVNFETSNAGTQSTLSAFATAVTNTWTKVGFYFDGAATTSTITPYIDVGTGWAAGTAQNITLSGLEEMNLVWGVKAGPTGAAETLQTDYIKIVQLR